MQYGGLPVRHFFQLGDQLIIKVFINPFEYFKIYRNSILVDHEFHLHKSLGGGSRQKNDHFPAQLLQVLQEGFSPTRKGWPFMNRIDNGSYGSRPVLYG